MKKTKTTTRKAQAEKKQKESLEAFCKRHGRKTPRLIVGDMMKKKDATYLDISTALNFSYPSNVRRLMTAQNLEFETLVKIAVALGVKVKDLIDE